MRPRKNNKWQQLKTQLFASSIAALSETMIAHPTIVLGNRIVAGMPFTLNPKVLYNGLFANMISIVPSIALAIFMSKTIEMQFFNKKKLSIKDKCIASSLGGACTSLFTAPIEHVLTKQHTAKNSIEKQVKFRQTFYKTYKSNAPWKMWNGALMISVRNGKSTMFLLGLIPYFELRFNVQSTNIFYNNLLAFIIGVTAGVVTTPANCIRSTQQASNCHKSSSLRNSIKRIYQTYGMLGFFKGGISRTARLAIGFPAIKMTYDFVMKM